MAEVAPSSFGPAARAALRRMRWWGATVAALRFSIVWIGAGSLLGSFLLPLDWPLAAGVGAAGALGLAWGIEWLRRRSVRDRAVELDRLGGTEDRCATLFEPLAPSLARLIGDQLEGAVRRGIPWPLLPWRRAVLAALVAASITAPLRSRPSEEIEPGPVVVEYARERAPLVAAAASELAGEGAAPETEDLAASLDRLARLLEAGSLDEQEAERLVERAEQELSDRASELAAAGREDERIQRALDVLGRRPGAPGTTEAPGEGRGPGETAGSRGDREASRDPLEPREEGTDSVPAPLAPGASWDPRFDAVVRRYFRER